jgi:hypothetical protein
MANGGSDEDTVVSEQVHPRLDFAVVEVVAKVR